MARSEVRRLLTELPILAVAIFSVLFVYWLGSQIGMSRWLTGVVSLTLLFLCVILFNFRQFDQVKQRGSLLLVAGFTTLSVSSLINEYVNHFFNPTYFYLFLAIAPFFIFFGYHAYLEWRALNSASVTNVQNVATRSNEWFRIYRGVAQEVNHTEDDANISGINFKLNGLSVHVPKQPNTHLVIKENDHIEFCGRPSFLLKNSTVCLAYRIDGDNKVYTVNEWWHFTSAVIGFILVTGVFFKMGFQWPLIFMLPGSIYFAVSSYWSFSARSFLANVKLLP